MIVSSIEHCFGINLDKEWLFAECGIPRTFDKVEPRLGGSIIFPPKNGILRTLPIVDAPKFVLKTQVVGKPGDRFNGGVKSGLFLSGYVVSGNSEQQITSHLRDLACWFEDHTQWEPFQ